MKKIYTALLAAGAFASAVIALDANKTLSVWSFTDEVEGLINDYYKPSHPDIKVQYSFAPTEQFPRKLDRALVNVFGAPDVVALEDAFVRKYVEGGELLPLDDIYAEIKSKMIKYPMQVGTYNGHVYAMSWQATSGAVFYRRSLARAYLGTDDPKEVGAMLCNMEKFVETAKTLKEKSNGTCVIVSSMGDLLRPYLSMRKQPWVVDGKVAIPDAMLQYMDMCKTFYDEHYDGRVEQWSDDWFAGMRGQLTDSNYDPIAVFCYFMPTWGLHYILKPNAGDTSGDWAMCAGPAPWRWGGTWLAAIKGTQNPAAAKEMIKYLCSDDKYLEKYALKAGDVVCNVNVQEKVKGKFSEPFLAGQNWYAQFAETSRNVDNSFVQKNEDTISWVFRSVSSGYARGRYESREEAISDFMSKVAAKLED